MIKYKALEDYLSRDDKLRWLVVTKSIFNIDCTVIKPNKFHDWVNQRDPGFSQFIPIGLKEKKNHLDVPAVFVSYSSGLKSNRDTWVYQFSEQKLTEKMQATTAFYNQVVDDYPTLAAQKGTDNPAKVVPYDAKKIKWDGTLWLALKKGERHPFSQENIYSGIYRPFCKQSVYFHWIFNNSVYRMPQYFPRPDSENRVICVTGLGASRDFSALMVKHVPNLHLLDTGQCFPLYVYRKSLDDELGLFDDISEKVVNVSDFALRSFTSHYEDSTIKKEDIFYYVYGLLHSPDYVNKYLATLKKQLPFIPFCEDFWQVSIAGKYLGELHMNYDSIETSDSPMSLRTQGENGLDFVASYSNLYAAQGLLKPVNKLKRLKDNSGIIEYCKNLYVCGIRKEAYGYVVNGKPAIDWIIERYRVKEHKESGIVNDPNDFIEESGDPFYLVKLIAQVEKVSVETVRIIERSLTGLKFQ